MAADAVGNLVSRRASACIAVRSAVCHAEIGFGLDYHSRNASTFGVRHNNKLSKQVFCDRDCIFAKIKPTRQFFSHTCIPNDFIM